MLKEISNHTFSAHYKSVIFFVVMMSIGITFPFVATARQSHDSINGNNQKNDANVIIPIIYPPITEREGKGLIVPVPAGEHPHLYLTGKDIPALQKKMDNPLLKDCWNRILKASAFTTNGLLQPGLKQNLDLQVRNAIEAKALLFLFYKDRATGRQAVEALLNFYATLTLDSSKQDICREVGRAITTGAIVYDWCYPLITAVEKQLLIGRMETLAIQLEVKWPKLVQGSVTGHGSEAQLLRDMLSCGIATYNEKPEIYNLVAGRIMAELVPARQFFYPASYHHQGSAYGLYRYDWDMYATFIFDKIGHPKIFGDDQAKVPYYFIYSRRPDGQLLRNGDDFNELFAPFGKYWNIGGNANLLAGSYFKDPILINEALHEAKPGNTADYLFDFLFYDVDVPNNTSKASLPLTKYFKEPFGAMIARTGWQDGLQSSAVVAEMKIGVYNFVNHQHLDGGGFQLYYKGPLTVQSGIYQGTTGGYGSEHFKNYSQRSIAHNTLLIYDPKEKFIRGSNVLVNDGGQRIVNSANEAQNLQQLLKDGYKTGEVLAHAFGPDSISPEFSYLKGELAAAYSGKVKSFKRSFVFLNLNKTTLPAALIVFDNVTTVSKDFKEYWLLHSVEEPSLNGMNTVITRSEKGYSGKMINTTLLPEQDNVTINKIGGAGNEYNVFGKNFPQSVSNPLSNSADSAMWRIEVSPKKASFNNLFLNVMQVMDNKVNSTLENVPEKIETDKLTGTKIGDRIVMFSKSGEVINDRVKLSITGKGEYKVLIADVQKGDWDIETGTNKIVQKRIKNDDGLLYFTIKEGDYFIQKK